MSSTADVKDGDIVGSRTTEKGLTGKVILHKGKPKVIWAEQANDIRCHACALSEVRIMSILKHENGE